MKLKISELNKNNYVLVDRLKHSELNVFLNDKLKLNKRWFFYAYVFLLVIQISVISYFITKNLITKELTLLDCFIYSVLGVLVTLLFIPIHELIHYLAYKITGAKSISFFANFKKFYFVTIADKFVTNLNEFVFIALLPFTLAMFGALILFPFLDIKFQLALLIFLFFHNVFCGGDFTLLNYFSSNKRMVTYDDKENHVTYFYKKQD